MRNELQNMAGMPDHQLLHPVYQEIADRLGVETAEAIYRMFRGQQVSFPMRFFHGDYIRQEICRAYDGQNIKALAAQYGYAEKTVRRIIKECGKKD